MAIVQLLFENSTIDPLQPLQEEISDGSLASILVNPELNVNPSVLSTATSMCKQIHSLLSTFMIAQSIVYQQRGCCFIVGEEF